MNFLLKKSKILSPPGADHGRKIKGAALLGQKFKMVDEDSHSTDLGVGDTQRGYLKINKV